jgi:uncharacterized protein YciI
MTTDIITTAVSALAKSVGSIINCDESEEALAETFAQFDDYVQKNVGDEVSKAVRGGPHSLTAALLDHLHDRLERRRDQHGYQKREDNMDSLTKIVKDIGPISVAKQIASTGRSFGISEAEYVEAASRHASELYGLPNDRAFTKLCAADGDVMRACGVLKAAELDAMTGSTTVYTMPRSAAPGRYTKADPVTHADTAYAELQAKAAELRKTRPELSEAQAFAAVYSDRSNIELAKRERREAAAR